MAGWLPQVIGLLCGVSKVGIKRLASLSPTTDQLMHGQNPVTAACACPSLICVLKEAFLHLFQVIRVFSKPSLTAVQKQVHNFVLKWIAQTVDHRDALCLPALTLKKTSLRHHPHASSQGIGSCHRPLSHGVSHALMPAEGDCRWIV